MRSHKEEFLKWADEKNIEIFDKVSDVMPDCKYDLVKGQTCTFRNYCFVDFPGCTIMGFCKPTLNGKCVYLDFDCYWTPVCPEKILLDGTKDQQCTVEVSYDQKCYILNINRVQCVLQSYLKDDYANINPIQNGNEIFEERLDNVRIDFYNKQITTEGHETVKWHNFTRTIDIPLIQLAIEDYYQYEKDNTVKMVENGEEFHLSPNVLKTGHVYLCEECKVYHLSPEVELSDIKHFDLSKRDKKKK